MYNYLKHEQTQGAVSVLYLIKHELQNGFKNDPFYTHLASLFAKEFSI